MPWYIKGTLTYCLSCGADYIQDQPQEFLDDLNECDPDPRLLCPKCRKELMGEGNAKV